MDYIFTSSPGNAVQLVREELLFRDGLWRQDGSERFWPSDHLPVLHEYAVVPAAMATGAEP